LLLNFAPRKKAVTVILVPMFLKSQCSPFPELLLKHRARWLATGVSARMKKVPFKRISGFIAAGGMATLFHWAAMSGLVLLGMAPVAATFSGSVVGAVTNYWLQRTLAFPNARPHIQAIWRYVFSCSLAALLNVLIFFVLHQLLEISVVPAQLLTTAAVAVFNYVVYQRLVFHEQTS
tara:strand:- start:410 stop:940 length:531 start_codon:yes stop_codon:yes gene_type:complete